jgi:hypothetical protein
MDDHGGRVGVAGDAVNAGRTRRRDPERASLVYIRRMDAPDQRHAATPRLQDPVVAAYVPGIDRTLLRENLKLTHEERIAKLQGVVDALVAARGAASRSR